LLALCVGGAAQAAGPKLTGTVLSDAGKPLPGASVFIYTAAPKEGVGILCPSCYPDCRKQAKSDGQGQFAIADMDGALLFKVLVVAKGFRPEFVSKVDPADGPVEAALKPVETSDDPKQRMRGRVVGPEGKPVYGAVVNIRGVTRGQSTRFGGNPDVDPTAVTDEAGEFVIHGREPFEAVGVDVVARALAKGIFAHLATGDTVHELKLSEGVSIQGRLMKNGKPLDGVEVGIAGAERSSEIFVGNYSVATDEEGRFAFVNLPARTAYYVYGIMKSLKDEGALAARLVRTQDDGSTLDTGDLKVEPGFTVSGFVHLTDGKEIPRKTRISLGREDAWDSQQMDLDSRGHFKFTGVPAESVHVSTRVSGYRLSARNASVDPLNTSSLIGRIHTNRTDLLIELEPGPRHDRLDGDQQATRAEPLRGVEGAGQAGGDIKVVGKVVDADTGKPLAQFTVTEGRKDNYRESFNWFSSRKTTHSDGAFTAYFTKQQQPPAVLIEAEGYLPQASGAVATAETNVTFALKKGSGYQGVLLRPDGKPAADVKVYLTDMKDGVYIDGVKLAVRENIYRGTRVNRADAEGRFSFTPQIDAYSIIVVDDAGFAQVPVEDLARNPNMRLQAWARIEGELKIGSKPGANEAVRLWPAHIPYEYHPRSSPPLSIFLNTTTDAAGKFQFERVPPIAVEVYHEPKVRDSRMGMTAMAQTTKLLLQPGETRLLTLGGKGRPVTGRMVVNDYEGKIDWRADAHMMETLVPNPPELPDLLSASRQFGESMRAASTDEERAAARASFDRQHEEMIRKTRAFYATDAGREYHFAKKRYALNFAQDGSFRIEDVPGGKYTLTMDLREGSGDSPSSRFSAPRIGEVQKEIEVPASSGGRSDEAFDLGSIEVQSRRPLKTGKAAPDFEVSTIDDKKIKLGDFKGKYLLLDFWAVWCGPCVAETPNLKETYEAFKNDPRFAMVGLSLDPAANAPRDYTKKNKLGWTQGFLGEWSKTDLPARYGVEGIPSIFLIGPDGKIVAKDLRGEAIRSTVESALRKKQ
jgi:peroxiredoxin/uncharacterized GH25 family protein